MGLHYSKEEEKKNVTTYALSSVHFLSGRSGAVIFNHYHSLSPLVISPEHSSFNCAAGN